MKVTKNGITIETDNTIYPNHIGVVTISLDNEIFSITVVKSFFLLLEQFLSNYKTEKETNYEEKTLSM